MSRSKPEPTQTSTFRSILSHPRNNRESNQPNVCQPKPNVVDEQRNATVTIPTCHSTVIYSHPSIQLSIQFDDDDDYYYYSSSASILLTIVPAIYSCRQWGQVRRGSGGDRRRRRRLAVCPESFLCRRCCNDKESGGVCNQSRRQSA